MNLLKCLEFLFNIKKNSNHGFLAPSMAKMFTRC